jgi:hypothetical protein
MSYNKNHSYAIMVAISLIALALVTTASFDHFFTAFAASKKKSSSSSKGVTTLGGGTSSASTAPNTNTLTKKELSSFISCINTANKSQGLTHKVVTGCLDTAKGITPASATAATAATSSSPSSIAPSTTSTS